MSRLNLSDYLEPNEYIDYYVNNPGAFTLSLSSIIESKLFGKYIESPLLNVEEFIKTTELEPLETLLNEVSKSLYSYETKVISLTQEMGFGKTHALIFLWMIYGELPGKYDELIKDPDTKNIIQKLRDKYKVGIVKNLYILPIDMSTVVSAEEPYEELLEVVRKAVSSTIILSGNPLNDARRVMEYISNEGGKFLVLIDELHHGAIKVYDNEQILQSFIKIMKFLTQLMDENGRLKIPLVLIYSSANQDVSRWTVEIRNRANSELRNAIDVFISRAKRMETTGLPYMTPESIIKIITKRLLRFKPPGRDEALNRLLGSIPNVKIYDTESYKSRLKKSFPFTPDLVIFIEKLMRSAEVSDLSRAQHLRSLLKIISKLINEIYVNGLWNETCLIPLGYLGFDDIKELIRDSVKDNWRTVYNSGQRIISEIGKNKESILKLIHSAIFTVSITDRFYKVYRMITGSIDDDELRLTSLPASRLIDPLIGVVDDDDLKLLVDASDVLKKHMIPFIQYFERGGDTYFYLSIIPDPRYLVDSIKESEIQKLFTKGEPDKNKMMSYLMDFLTSERFYEILYNTAERNEINAEIVEPEKLLGDGLLEIIRKLPRDIFSIIISKPVINDINARMLTNTLNERINDIPAPNLFSVVLSKLDTRILFDICRYIAMINAYKRALDLQQVKSISKVADQTGLRRALEPFREEEKIDDKLLADMLKAVLNTLDRYVKTMIGSSVSILTHRLASIFQEVVFFDPRIEKFVIGRLDLVVSNDKRDKICILVSDAIVKRTLNVCNVKHDREELSELILDFLRNIAQRDRDLLLRNREIKIEGKQIITNLIKGWKDIPIKPKRISLIRNSVFPALSGKPLGAPDPELIQAKIKLLTDSDTILVYMPKKAKTIVSVREQVGTVTKERYFKVIYANGDTNVSICLHNINRIAKEFGIGYRVTLNMKLYNGEINISNANSTFIDEIFGSFDDFINIIDDLRSEIEDISIRIHLDNSLPEKELRKYFGTAVVNYS